MVQEFKRDETASDSSTINSTATGSINATVTTTAPVARCEENKENDTLDMMDLTSNTPTEDKPGEFSFDHSDATPSKRDSSKDTLRYFTLTQQVNTQQKQAKQVVETTADISDLLPPITPQSQRKKRRSLLGLSLY